MAKLPARVGVIGSGEVGKVLAEGFLQQGCSVMRGSREPAKLEPWRASAASLAHAGAELEVGTDVETARFGELVVLAVKGGAAEEVIQRCREGLAAKTVLDTTNPIAEKPPVNGMLSFFTTLEGSLMERLQAIAPEAHFVKCFSSVGADLMVSPKLPSAPSMFICGDDAGARAQARQVLDAFGWETEDMGAAIAARAIEPLCLLWCIPGFLRDEWTHAFKLVRTQA